MTKKHLFLILSLLFSVTCRAADDAAPLCWADSALWFEGTERLAPSHIDDARPDVFYVLPTCVFAWKDSCGTEHYNADPHSAAHRKAWQLSAELADSIFATRANLFLPYYRQSTFGTPDEESRKAAADMARRDVTEAFHYYLQHLNGNRPFILAGFSQGARMVVELLKDMDDRTYHRLIAAYVVGYGITASDTMHPAGTLQHIRLACDSASKGVTVCFNSVTSPDAINPSLCAGNIACINPVTWTTSEAPATLLCSGDTPKADDKRFPYGTAVMPAVPGKDVTVRVDNSHKVLIVSGIDSKRYCLPSLKSMFPEGNLHLQELFFYGDLLRQNVLLRCR